MIPTPDPEQQTLPFIHDLSPCEELDSRPSPYRWKCPTLAEFLHQLEHRFGEGVSRSRFHAMGIDLDEVLPPRTVRAFCEQLGVPPEDFGI